MQFLLPLIIIPYIETYMEMNPLMSDEFSNLNGIYDELSNEFGLEVALKIYSMFKGQQITFPMYLFNREYVTAQIQANYNGANAKQLATQYGYSERWVRKIAKSNKT